MRIGCRPVSPPGNNRYTVTLSLKVKELVENNRNINRNNFGYNRNIFLEPVINLLLKLSVQSKYIRALRLGWQTNERVIRVT